MGARLGAVLFCSDACRSGGRDHAGAAAGISRVDLDRRSD
jgi:hypothetical protein